MLIKWRSNLAEPIILALLFTSVFYLTFDKQPHYDSVRNLIIAQEITQRGIPTYFDSVYWQHPPLLHYSIAFVSKLLGIHVYYGAKILILGLSFMSLIFFYLFCSTLFEKNFARISTAMLAFTPLFWWNANDIMQAMGELFFFTTALFFFYRAIKTEKKRDYVISGIFLGMGMLMRVSAIVLVPIMFSYIIFEKKRAALGSAAIKRMLLVFLAAGIVFSPYFIYRTINGGPSIFNQAIEETFKGKAGWLPSGDISSPPLYYITDFFSIASFTTVFVIIGIYFALKRKDRQMSLPLLWFSMAMIVLSILSHKENRFMIIGLPAIVMIGAYGIFSLKDYFKKNENVFYIIPAVILITLFYSGFTSNTNDGYWPFNFEAWNYINNLDNDVASKEWIGSSNLPYGIVKLLTNKYSDFVPLENNPQTEIYSAIRLNTPYIFYPGNPERQAPFVKVKYFEDCNCTLYKINGSFEGVDLKVMDEKGNSLNGATVDLFDTTGKQIFSSKANSQGYAFIPVDKFTGILVVDKICYNPVQEIIQIESGSFRTCSQKQAYNGFSLVNTVDCMPSETTLKLTFKGCFSHQYSRSRF